MSSFKVGDLVRFDDKKADPKTYGITTSQALCVVLELEGSAMRVGVVKHVYDDACWKNSDHSFGVSMKYFTKETIENYTSLFPDHYTISPGKYKHMCTLYALNSDLTINSKSETETTTLMDKSVKTVITDEERVLLEEEIIELLEMYDYHPTEKGVNTLIDKWIERKGWMIELFKKHPNYNGKFQIVFDSDYYRGCDVNAASNAIYWLRGRVSSIPLEEVMLGKRTYQEVVRSKRKIEDILYLLGQLEDFSGIATAAGKTSAEWREEIVFVRQLYDKYRTAYHNSEIMIDNGMAYSMNSYLKRQKTDEFFYYLANYHSVRQPMADNDLAERANRISSSIKAVPGMKVSRLVNKICKVTGIDQQDGYNALFAQYADAINPLEVKRHTVISCHPIDYLTMSFGNSWSSCHTIDKKMIRSSNSQSGCHGGGTLSYALDESSCVFYTVNKKYDGNQLELQDKINRCMFHLGEDKLVQGRVYPASEDSDENGIYKTIREIMQKVISDCLETPNLWSLSKGTSACYEVINNQEGAHYPDFFRNNNCNVSYLKREGFAKNTKEIKVGSYHICPSCGEEHTTSELIECYTCYHDCVECECCGSRHDREDMIEIDGCWYCSDCTFYCDYHEEYELYEDRAAYIEEYGDVCECALENDCFICCNRCGKWFYISHIDYIVTEDCSTYCSDYCATRDGYVWVNREEAWFHEDETTYCEICCEYVLSENYNYDADMCASCAAEQ